MCWPRRLRERSPRPVASVTEALLLNAALLAGAMFLLWLVALAIGKVGFVDAVWGGAMAVLALASFLHLERRGDLAILICGMTMLWGLRLAIHLLRRFRRNGEDARYERLLAKGSFARGSLLRVFAPQAALIFLVSSPAQVGILAAGAPPGLPPLALAGLALWLVGVFFEWVGDWQLASFKADPDNAGKVMDAGLWRYTRHPNYFGDACAWWGIWLACAATGWENALLTVAGPLFLTFTLVKWSGAAMTEKGMRGKYGEAFADYVRRTPAFVPGPPRNT